MKINRYISLMALCLVSCGLPYCKKTHLSEEEMEWINIYGKKENILFSDGLSIDTFTFIKKNIFNKVHIPITDLKSCNWIEGQHEYIANASIDFKIKHNTQWWQGVFIISKNMDSTFVSEISFGGLYSDEVALDKTDTSISFKNGVNSEEGSNQPLLGIEEIIWDKEKGIICYKLKDGRVFHKLED